MLWQSPHRGWLNLNYDGATTPTSSASGGLARDCDDCFDGSIASFLGDSNSLIVELSML